jgi:pSer/pThr/pTyr-binding forkhead associated (FHA) protein
LPAGSPPVAMGGAPPVSGAPGMAPTAPLPQYSLSPDGSVIQAPVVGVATPGAPDVRRTACGRCGGANPTGMAYCQFCGSPLAAGAPAPMGGVMPAAAMAAPAAAGQPELPRPPAAGVPMAPAVHAAPLPSAQEGPAPVAAWGGAPADGRAPGSHAVAEQAPLAGGPGLAAAGPAEDLARPRLVVIGQDGTPGREYPLVGEQIDLGREEGDIRLPNDPYISPRHARIRRRDGRFSVQDLESLNGVFLRIRRAEPIENGDLLLVGLEVLRFETVTGAEKGLGVATERGTRVFGSPAAPRYARLIQQTVEGVPRDVVYLGREELTIGREQGDLVFTADPFMSRRHLTLRRDAATGAFEIHDLGSSNGTYLAIRGEVPLKPGDHLRIGQHLFRLDVDRRQ